MYTQYTTHTHKHTQHTCITRIQYIHTKIQHTTQTSIQHMYTQYTTRTHTNIHNTHKVHTHVVLLTYYYISRESSSRIKDLEPTDPSSQG